MGFLTRLGRGRPGSADSLTALSDSDRLGPDHPNGPAGPTQPARPESPRAHRDSDRPDRPAQSASSSCKEGRPAHAAPRGASLPRTSPRSPASHSLVLTEPRLTTTRSAHAHHTSAHPHALTQLASGPTAARPLARARTTHPLVLISHRFVKTILGHESPRRARCDVHEDPQVPGAQAGGVPRLGRPVSDMVLGFDFQARLARRYI